MYIVLCHDMVHFSVNLVQIHWLRLMSSFVFIQLVWCDCLQSFNISWRNLWNIFATHTHTHTHRDTESVQIAKFSQTHQKCTSKKLFTNPRYHEKNPILNFNLIRYTDKLVFGNGACKRIFRNTSPRSFRPLWCGHF